MRLKVSIADFWAGTAVTAAALTLVCLVPRASSVAQLCAVQG